ncbi:MAG: hypothetical protein E4G94_06820 [ANME-2 cluster archaeon]|nr:MAG: hypothetical protein E4G94_06820 [ANME-2 cluster archaeon]
MKKEEIAKKGMSFYGSLQNRKDHKKFSDTIDTLNARNRFNIIDLGSLRTSMNKHFNYVQKLKTYAKSNFKVTFNKFRIVEKILNSHKKMINEQQSEIEELKLKIAEFENKI